MKHSDIEGRTLGEFRPPVYAYDRQYENTLIQAGMKCHRIVIWVRRWEDRLCLPSQRLKQEEGFQAKAKPSLEIPPY
jgi:hypothetical protein